MVTDGPIIRDARKVAFKLVENDPNLKNKVNKMIRETFIREYADRLEGISLS
jgi:hypothetical protein